MKPLKTLSALALLMLSPFASAVETVVTPGVGTLETAIAAATDGDVLLLQTGTYRKSGTVCSHLVVDKSVTIRAISKAANPIIASISPGGCSIGVQIATAKSVTIQGVQLDDGYFACNDATSVRLLENLFNIVSSTSAIFGCNTDELVMVGNTVTVPTPTSWRSMNNSTVGTAYIAGNTFVNGVMEIDGDSIWVVGNKLNYSVSGGISAVIDVDATTHASVIGNRIGTPPGVPFNDNSDFWTAIRAEGNVLVASNLIAPVVTSAYGIRGVYKGGAAGSAQVLNNVYYRTDAAPDTQDVADAIEIAGPGLIAGNIVIGHQSTASINATTASVMNNICFNNVTDCGTADGNLTSDPQFVDTVDFQLGATSPGIDAGPSDYQYADLDRTQNDIGAYGGPWELGQYDAQRNSSLVAPYVYPLFDTNSAINDGKLHVRSLGVARLR